MIDLILIGVFIGSLGLIGLGVLGFKSRRTPRQPSVTIIHNKGTKPIKVRIR